MVEGKELPGPIPESIRLFILCDSMKWNHLPVGGGLYDQHPDLLSDWQVIFQRRAEKQAADMAAQEAKNKPRG